MCAFVNSEVEHMGRPVISRAIKRRRLEAAGKASDVAGQVTPSVLEQILKPKRKSKVATPTSVKKRARS